jgi:predicted transcriptional regulator
MNTLERLLQDELHHLVDRVAARMGQGTVAGIRPDLKARVELSEARLTGLRAGLLEGYAEWARALEECEDLWALAELRQQTEDATECRRAA